MKMMLPTILALTFLFSMSGGIVTIGEGTASFETAKGSIVIIPQGATSRLVKQPLSMC
jgi:hypothetical protein